MSQEWHLPQFPLYAPLTSTIVFNHPQLTKLSQSIHTHTKPTTYYMMSALKIKAALEELRRAFRDSTPYDQLTGARRHAAMRRCLLTEAADAISGGCGKSLLRDVCAGDNVTARRIAQRVGVVRELACHGAHSVAEREYVINSLAFLLPEHGRDSIKQLGCSIGKDLYATVRTFVDSADLRYAVPSGAKEGRVTGDAGVAIPGAWRSLAHDSGRVLSDGTPILTLSGGLKRAARAVALESNCSERHAYRMRPRDVVTASKLTDLCPLCEGLRTARLSVVSEAIELGANVTHPGDCAGQKAVRGPGEVAAEFLIGNPNLSPGTKELLAQYEALKWHEDLARQLDRRYQQERRDGLVLTFDFGSRIQLKSGRGDSREWFKALSIGRFGLAVSRPDGHGASTLRYVDIYFLKHKNSSYVAAACLAKAVSTAMEQGWIGRDEDIVKFFCDKGSHFASGEMVYSVLTQVMPTCPDVELCFHPAYHGKTIVDGHFGVVKQRLDGLVVEKWPRCEDFLRGTLTTETEGLVNTKAAWLSLPGDHFGHREKFDIFGLSATHSVRRILWPDGAAEFFIEGVGAELKPFSIRTPVDGDQDGESAELDPKAGCVTDLRKLVHIAKRQKRLLEQVGSQASCRKMRRVSKSANVKECNVRIQDAVE